MAKKASSRKYDDLLLEIEELKSRLSETQGTLNEVLTDIKRSEESIKYHSYLLDNVSDAIIGTDAELRITLWNAGAERIYGYKAEEVINRSAREVLRPIYIGLSREQVVDRLKGGSVNTEIIHLTKEGKKVIVESHSVGLYDEDGRFTGSVGVNRDITERKQIEEKLKISEARFRAVQDNSLDRFTILKPFYDDKSNIIDFVYLYQNARAAKATGLSPEELVGRRMTDIFPTFPKTHFFSIYKQTVETNQPAEFEDQYSADGVNDWFYVRVTPIPEGIAIATQIITERKQLQEELKKNNENLEEQVRLRTRELEDQRKHLQKVNEDLLRSNIELDKFASVASHDLQEPLRSVTSFAQLLALKYGNTFDNDAREYLDYIVDGGKRMYELINGLLTYSKLSKKEINFFSLVDLNNIVDTVKENLIQVIKERSCTIECDRLPCVEADPNQMIRLFQNLISNAIKFSKDSPHIYISCKREQNRYVLSVRDEGIGIESRYFQKIFEIFKRLMPRNEYEGTGIGLTICKKIIENHNGEIWVESEPGKESTFTFSIPKKQSAVF